MSKIPLGQETGFPCRYAPQVLFPIARREAREAIGMRGTLPFNGEDVWNGWEMTWLDDSGRPVIATATIRVSADSANIVESKSMKLYLGSFAMTRYGAADEVGAVVSRDLAALVQGDVSVHLATGPAAASGTIGELPGHCIDDAAGEFSSPGVDPALLRTDGETVVTEALHSHLLRSLCPVTNQPDMGSLLVRYQGRRIDPGALLQYIVSFREHNDFHEACVERMFLDIRERCRTEKLTVYARYNRRGGIDINPFRSDFEAEAPNIRLWRQ